MTTITVIYTATVYVGLEIRFVILTKVLITVLGFHDGSSLMLIPILGIFTMWKWTMLQHFGGTCFYLKNRW
jgi:hypothetical protein